MGWSKKYKKSIDCNNPKGFSQKAHCAGRKKREGTMSLKLEELVGKKLTEEQFDEAAGKKDACYHKVKARYDVWPSAYASGALVKCRKVGAKNWGNKSKKEGIEEKMRPAIKKALAQKGYGPIFNAIEVSKRQLKQLRYSRGEIQDTLIDMFGDGDPKILKKIKEDVNILGVKKMNEGKFRVHFDLNPDASPAERLGLMSVEVKAKNKKEAEKMVADKFVGGMKLIKKSMTKKLKEGLNEANYTHNYPSITAMAKDYKRIFPSTGPAGGVKIISGSKREATGKRSQPAFIRIEGDKKLIDAYKKIAFSGKGNYSDVIKSLKEATIKLSKKEMGKLHKDGKLKKGEHEIEFNESYDVWNDKTKVGYTLEFKHDISEAEYQGRKVKLGKPMQGDSKKFKVYVKNPKGNVVKVNFGQKGMNIKKSNPDRRKSFRARHNCDNPGPRHKARYWSCRKW